MKYYILLIFSVFCIISCKQEIIQNTEVEVIDINNLLNNKKFDSTKYRYDGHVIKLETTEDCLIDRIRKLFFSENRIYIKTISRQLFIFDHNGKYIGKINTGNGRGEVARLQDATFDDDKNELIISDLNYIKFFTPNGEFIREQEYPYNALSINTTKNGFLLQNSMGEMGYDDMPKATVLFADKDWNIKAAYLNLVNKNTPFSTGNMSIVQKNNVTGIISLDLVCTDTIYHFYDEKLEAKYVFDYSSKAMDKEKAGTDDFMKEVGLGRICFTGCYTETSTHQYFHIGHNMYLRDKINKKIIGGMFDNTESEYYPQIYDIKATYNDYFVSAFEIESSMIQKFKASDFLSQEDVDKINSMTYEDNPALIFFKLKEFNEEE